MPPKDDLSAELQAIRADIQNLASTVRRIAKDELSQAQASAAESAKQAEDAIRRNPLQAVAIAAGLGFLLGVITRR
jgi:ElaB/YqjD/DUF883 family membrane-anchored ribosome-binding protein